ncbi:MAG: riboflavin synthase [Calditrichaeota bacterium]|nr:MAG: riboflavin synthase [Calditrichota bacterium]
MFTGLVEEVGSIASIRQQETGRIFRIQADTVLRDVHIGDSILVDGVCLTVVTFSAAAFDVEAVEETLHRSTLSAKKAGDRVNLERAMAANGRFGGHFVQGHIDGKGEVVSLENRSPGFWITIQLPNSLLHYVVEKGSIAVDGISLTVAQVKSDQVSIAVIPHTWRSTTLCEKKQGESLNIETDVIAKYIFKLIEPARFSPGVTWNKLYSSGFTEIDNENV